jgi:biotin transport system substrate-specific component
MQSTFPIPLGAAQDPKALTRTLAGRSLLAVSATAFVALCAHVSVPLYFTPVPVTLQTMAVILVGLNLGPALGSAALVLYLAEGAVGLPVFSPNGPGGITQLLGPTAGYLFSYPLAAAVAGGVIRAARAIRLGQSQLPAAILAGLAASIFIFAMGAGWLAHLLHLNANAAWHLGVQPFLPGEILKIAAAASAYTAIRKGHRAGSY